MARSAASILLLLSIAITAVICAVPKPASSMYTANPDALQVYTDVVVVTPNTIANGEIAIDKNLAVTPYGYKSMMLQKSTGRKVACWRCSNPCSAYMCCDDGYPQCCLYNGRCMCCRL